MSKKISLSLVFLLMCFSLPTYAQNCPDGDAGKNGNAAPTFVHGIIRYHNELRNWLGLQPDKPVCGQKEIQLTFRDNTSLRWRQTQALAGCGANITGIIGASPTGYYSADKYISDPDIKPDSSCHPASVLPDLTQSPIPSDLKNYQASVTINLGKNEPMKIKVWRTDEGKTDLAPWQAYVRPLLTGGEALWVNCREGYHSEHYTTQISGHSKVTVNDCDDMPGFGPPESGDSTITISCVRDDISPSTSCR